MIRPVETLTEATLLGEGIARFVKGKTVSANRVELAPGVRLRVGPGAAELTAIRIFGGLELGRVHVDRSLEPTEWAAVWLGGPADA